jgi:hypothetical protein
MQAKDKEIAFDWIRSGRYELAESRTPEWVGNFVAHLMPTIFETYAKVLHRIDAKEVIDKPLSPSEIAILKIPPCEPLKSFVESRRAGSQSGRIRWRELAELLNVAFAPEICLEWFHGKLEVGCWPRFLSGPGEGELSEEECWELASALTPFTDTGPCFFRFAEIPFIGTDKALVFKGSLNEVCGFLTGPGKGYSFEYWWPADRSWCVCSDYDLKFTVVGGSKTLISALLRSHVLECLEVNPQTRIDSFAPMPLNLR